MFVVVVENVRSADVAPGIDDGDIVYQGRPQIAAGDTPNMLYVKVVKLGVFVNSDPAFTDQPKVANGASELMQDVFGEAGRHARSAVGVAVLPLGVAVEVDAIVAVRS